MRVLQNSKLATCSTYLLFSLSRQSALHRLLDFSPFQARIPAMPSVSPLLTVLARSPPRVPLSSPIAVLAVTGPLRRCLTNPLAHSHFAGSSMLFTNWHTHICAKLQPTAVVSFGLLPDLEPADGGLACCSNRFGGDFRSSDPVA